MMIEKGCYIAVKDVAIRSGNAAWMLMDGGKIEVVQINNEKREALVRCDGSLDWMHFSRIKKCFRRCKGKGNEVSNG